MKRIRCCEAFWDSSKLENCPRCNERLSPAGSGATTGCADAQRGQPVGAEERSREDGGVATGAAHQHEWHVITIVPNAFEDVCVTCGLKRLVRGRRNDLAHSRSGRQENNNEETDHGTTK